MEISKGSPNVLGIRSNLRKPLCGLETFLRGLCLVTTLLRLRSRPTISEGLLARVLVVRIPAQHLLAVVLVVIWRVPPPIVVATWDEQAIRIRI